MMSRAKHLAEAAAEGRGGGGAQGMQDRGGDTGAKIAASQAKKAEMEQKKKDLAAKKADEEKAAKKLAKQAKEAEKAAKAKEEEKRLKEAIAGNKAGGKDGKPA